MKEHLFERVNIKKNVLMNMTIMFDVQVEIVVILRLGSI